MKILLDECFPKQLKSLLKHHVVKTVTEMEWNSLENGNLMRVAIKHDFDVLLTIDKNLQHQQNLKAYHIAIVVLDVRKSKVEFLKPLVLQFLQMAEQFGKREVLYNLSINFRNLF